MPSWKSLETGYAGITGRAPYLMTSCKKLVLFIFGSIAKYFCTFNWGHFH